MRNPTRLKNQHLLWRAGFGPSAEELAGLSSVSPRSLFKSLVKASSGSPAPIDVADDYLKEMLTAMSGNLRQKKELSGEEKREIQRKHRENIKQLNVAWLNEMVNSRMQLREKMAFFWHGHFACISQNIFYQQLLLNVIRRNALGDFGNLLSEVSKSAAMINFLNNNQNRKNRPNENFAREVMELFTMGRGNYTETDIKEAARAFTGWGATVNGEFIFRKNQHDEGVKTILGKTGNFNGDDVLKILLENKQTSVYITRKIYRYFVNGQEDEAKVQSLAKRFYQSGYNIESLLEDIFTGDWFYDTKNIGCKIKSPVELLVGIRRMLPMEIENEEIQLTIQRILGQQLFYPPNVAGWPGGRSWIDSSSLMFRLRIPQMISEADEIKIKSKDNDDQMMGMKEVRNQIRKKAGQQILANIDWNTYLKKFAGTPREKLQQEIEGMLLQIPPRISETVLGKHVNADARDVYVKSVTVQLMSTPEYQMC